MAPPARPSRIHTREVRLGPRGSLSNWAQTHGVHASGIFSIQDAALFADVAANFRKLSIFKERDTTGHGMYGATLKRYAEFLAATAHETPATETEARQKFASAVKQAMSISPKERAKRRKEYGDVPRQYEVTTTVFDRNPYVVADVLLKANGTCQQCGNAAPFHRRSDKSPYLEVHHVKPLAQGGLDVVENAIALCPNFHRKAHFG